jgi:hypothetical protein
MANGTFDLTFDSVAHTDGIHGGRRYATDWKSEDGRMWRVSSVDHRTALETMVFEIVDGEPTYFDVAAVKEYMENKRDHGAFLAEYLQMELNESHNEDVRNTDDLWVGMPKSVRLRGCPPDLSTFTENSP